MSLHRAHSPNSRRLATPYHQSQASMLPFIDMGDNDVSIDLDTFHHSGNQPRIPHLQTFARNYDDACSNVFTAYDGTATREQHMPLDVPPETPALERGSVYLKFCQPSSGFELLDYTCRSVTLSFSAQLNGMFFLAPSPASPGEAMTSSPTAVACYRRNLFSVSGAIMLPRSLRYVATERGDQIPIVSMDLAISAVESLEGNFVKLISVPYKSSLAPGTEDSGDREPGLVPLDMMNGADLDDEFATFPIEWKRLQFRTSTANNGRRKELQQHFILNITVLATLSTGQRISVCEASSGPIVVRGRSPRNFQPKKPNSASISIHKPLLHRTKTGEACVQNLLPYEQAGSHVTNCWTWSAPNSYHSSAGFYPADNYRISPNGFHNHSSPDRLQYKPQTSPFPPRKLSLINDESEQPQYSKAGPAKKSCGSTLKSQQPSELSLGPLSGGEPKDSKDLLHEYFPLYLDDWQDTVDVSYRPQVVNPANLRSSARATATKSKSKR